VYLEGHVSRGALFYRQDMHVTDIVASYKICCRNPRISMRKLFV